MKKYNQQLLPSVEIQASSETSQRDLAAKIPYVCVNGFKLITHVSNKNYSGCQAVHQSAFILREHVEHLARTQGRASPLLSLHNMNSAYYSLEEKY